MADVAVIGAGSSGLAVLRALRAAGVEAVGLERRQDVGGLWRAGDDSPAYGSLRTNVSRARMEYPSFPMPSRFGDFPHHTEMAAYLGAYADAFGLRELIRFGTAVERLEPDGERWRVIAGGVRSTYTAVVAAVGHDRSPKRPDHPGWFDGEMSHACEYRTAAPFAGRRVLVVGAGQSAGEIAVEIAGVAARTCLSVRSGTHVIPRWIGGSPYDAGDAEPHNRIPWRLLNRLYGREVARERGALPPSWPAPAHRLLEGIPILSSELLPAIRRGAVEVKPGIERLAGARIRFDDGSEAPFDALVYATGYAISLPFLSPLLLAPRGRELPLYRRIVPPGLAGLFLAGFVDAPGGLLPVVEAQGEWIAAVLTGAVQLPPERAMWPAIARAERRTRERFPAEGPHSIRCDPHAYRRLLRADLRRASSPV